MGLSQPLRLLIALLCWLALGGTVSSAETNSVAELAALLKTTGDLREQGKYAEALPLARRLVERTEQTKGAEHPETAIALHNLATLYVEMADYARAEPLYLRSLKIWEKQLGPQDPHTANTLKLLAQLYEAMGDYARAEPLLQRSLKIREEQLGPEHPDTASSLNSLALLYAAMGDYARAESLLQRSSRITEKTMGAEHRDTATALNNLASLHQAMGDYSRAEALCQRSLKIREKQLGPEHPDTGASLHILAGIYRAMGDYARAEALYQRNLKIFEKALGPEHPTTATSLNSLATLYLEMADYARAEPLLKRSLKLLENALGSEHPTTANSLNSLAGFYHQMGDNVRAEPLYHRSLMIREKSLGPEHPDTANSLNNLASFYQDLGDYAHAEPLYQRSLKIREKQLGPEHPDTAASLNNLASLYAAMGDYARAEPLHQRSLKIREKQLGPEHPDTAISLENLASLYTSMGDYDQAVRPLLTALRSQKDYLVGQVSRGEDGLRLADKMLYRTLIFHSLCALGFSNISASVPVKAAEQLASCKALLEEVEATRASLDADSRTSTRELRENLATIQNQLFRLPQSNLDSTQREARRRQLQIAKTQIERALAEWNDLVSQTIRERNLTLTDIAGSLPPQSVLVDFIQYRRYDFAAKKHNEWKEQRYAAYVTFPLARDSTNVVVERVDLGEAAPFNEAVELVCKRMSAGQFAAKDLSPALQRLSQLVYAPLAPYLTNVSHLIVCPDGQLSRLPFEMLSVGNKFLVEEKTISYVTSGREVVRLQSRAGVSPAQKENPAADPDRRDALSYVKGKSLVMGNPDFDLDLRVAQASQPAGLAGVSASSSNNATRDASELAGVTPALRSLSRDYRGLRFNPLPGSGVEATNVAKLLGADAYLQLGADAREAELKAVVSPRVLHLATHGFFLSDQELRTTNSRVWSSAFTRPGPPEGGTPNWENPLLRCGIALAGANHATNLMARSSRREEAQTKTSQASTTTSRSDSQSLLTSSPTRFDEEDGLLTGLEASLLNLQGTELVILSACDSGTGEVKIGEGVMSLRRAFRIAGAETVLASHWKVSDKATSQLMTEFMRRWRAGEPRAKAWREAQLSLLRSKDFANPYFWAAFTLTGQWN